MKTPLCLASAALLLTGCYTQLYTRGYAERAAYPYPDDRAAAPGDSAVPDSLRDSLAAADSARRPNTVIVNNYYRESPYYRGYPIDAWDYPYVSFGFYSGRYRDYYGPYWWSDPYYSRHRWYHRYHGRPGGGSGGGSTVEPGPYRSDKRIFPPASPQPPVRKGKRSEPAPEAAPKESGGSSNAEPARSSSGGEASPGSSSSSSSSSASGSSRDSGDNHPALQKGRRR